MEGCHYDFIQSNNNYPRSYLDGRRLSTFNPISIWLSCRSK